MVGDDVWRERLGTASVAPDGPVVAGSVGTWVITYTVGSYGIDEGGTIKLGQRFASDWQPPQFDDPAAPAYSTVTTTGDAKLRPHFEKKGHDRPWMKCLVIDVYDGSLSPGDVVTITLGDTSRGGPGIRAQTFQESAHEFRVFIDPTNACIARAIVQSPTVRITPGEARSLVVIVPTQATLNAPAEVFVKGEDPWSNPVLIAADDADLSLQYEGDGDAGIDGRHIAFTTPGRGHIVASWRGLTGRSNPIAAYDDAARPRFKQYWGDLHAQTDSTVGTGTEAEYFTFGRDVARLDFTSHQGNDFQLTDEDWRRLNDTVRAFHEDGRFVVFPGYEWSANTPAGGDRNVFYLEEGMPIYRSSHWQVPTVAEDEATPAHPADELFARIRENVPLEKVLLASHVGGRYADIRRYFDEGIGPLVEVVSCWGVFEWMLWDAFEHGHIVGVMCNSDGHKGRPGAEGPGAGEFGIANGLTCVLAEARTRQRIFEALQDRRCYGTTGPRIDLRFEIAQMPMGSVLHCEQADAVASVRGCAPMESLTLYRGIEPIMQVRPRCFDDLRRSPRLRITWRGSRMRGRGRRVRWDGQVRIEGATICDAKTVSFDAATDGITDTGPGAVRFRSQTTGDSDGLDLLLDDAAALKRIVFDTQAGQCEVTADELNAAEGRKVWDFGGLDMAVTIERYPQSVTDFALDLRATLDPPAGQVTPYFVKAVQVDGHMAWSSPIYLHA